MARDHSSEPGMSEGAGWMRTALRRILRKSWDRLETPMPSPSETLEIQLAYLRKQLRLLEGNERFSRTLLTPTHRDSYHYRIALTTSYSELIVERKQELRARIQAVETRLSRLLSTPS